MPSARTDLPRPIRRVEYGQASSDVVQNANRARQLPVQWTSWLSYTRPDPPTLQELQSDILRRQKLERNVQLIEARDREERERMQVSHSETLRLSQAQEEPTTRTQPPPPPPRQEPKAAEDPWEKAKKESGPEQPSSWTPMARSRRD